MCAKDGSFAESVDRQHNRLGLRAGMFLGVFNQLPVGVHRELEIAVYSLRFACHAANVATRNYVCKYFFEKSFAATKHACLRAHLWHHARMDTALMIAATTLCLLASVLVAKVIYDAFTGKLYR